MTAREKGRLLLGATLVAAGVTHLTVARKAFKAQVPDWAADLSPFSKDDIVLLSGAAEIALGAALAGLPAEKERLGALAAGFFTGIFPGNISQYTQRRDAFGLDTDGKRLARLFFQPALVAWALWCTRVEKDVDAKLKRGLAGGIFDKDIRQALADDEAGNTRALCRRPRSPGTPVARAL